MPHLIAYYRVSTDKQGESGLGLEAQKRMVRGYADLYGHSILAEFTDVASGTTTEKRPQLAEALSLAQSEAVMNGTAIVFAKLDRIARNVRDLLGILDKVPIISVGEQFDSSSAAGRLVLTVLGAVAEWESRVIKERTIASMAVARSQGRRVGGRGAPFGWAVDGNGMLVPQEGEQRVLGLLRCWRDRGMTLLAIACEATSRGSTRRGTPWTAQSIHATLARADELQREGT